MSSRAESSASHASVCVGSRLSLRSAWTPSAENTWPNTAAARSTLRASVSSDSSRACTIAIMVCG